MIDANRRQVCEDLADRLLQSDSLIGRVVGAAVGERIGWAPERIAALRDERRVLEAVSGGMTYQGIGHGSDGQMPQDCGAFRVLTRNALLNNWVRSG